MGGVFWGFTGCVIAALSMGNRAVAEGPPFAATLDIAAVDEPTFMTQAPGDPDRLYVAERPGRIRVIDKGRALAEPLLDFTALADSNVGENAFSSFAFHPKFQENGQIFVVYTNRFHENVVARFQVTAGQDPGDLTSHTVLLTLPDPDPTHNMGWCGFGDDGALYVGSGDGGLSTLGAPSQDPGSLRGKLLRFDVEKGGPPEIWALGLRNPWRCSFDRATGDLWIADVGQSYREEIDLLPAGASGANFGWNCMEGTTCHVPANGCECDQEGLTAPLYEYNHKVGCAIIGGYVYRGSAIPQLQGRYVFGDLCTAAVKAYDPASGEVIHVLETVPELWSFGEDAAGELYVLAYGYVRKIVPVVTPAPGDLTGDGIVDSNDVVALLGAWGRCPGPPKECPADFSGDGVVSTIDLLILLALWG